MVLETECVCVTKSGDGVSSGGYEMGRECLFTGLFSALYLHARLMRPYDLL